MRFGTTRSQIYDAQKTAQAHWLATEEFWTDEVRREHGEKCVVPLDAAVSDVLRAIDQLAIIATQLRHECEFTG
ncbi:MAG: hypothetical protein RMJ56_16475 [Gemmataceae bacterium]|nr:hypothetical protein [Gemmata sp.]MDW8199193.1 hypothetical protein [Gemmataceae bacterium]